MSRTTRGSKGPGYDYWSKAANGEGKHAWKMPTGRECKKILNRAARSRVKQRLKKAFETP